MPRTIVARSLAGTPRALVSGRGSGSPTVTTQPYAPTFTNIGVTLLTQTSVRVTWASDQSLTEAKVDHGATAAYGTTTTPVSSGTSVSIDITGLTAGTLYHYRIRGTNAGAQETVGSDATFTTDADPLPASGGTDGIETGITYTDYFIPATYLGTPIDDTGTTDCTAILGQWLATVPNGASASAHSRVRPRTSTSTYLISGNITNGPTGFQLKGTPGAKRQHITFWGEGKWANFPITQTTAADATQKAAVRAAYAAFDKDTAWTMGATIIRRGGGSSAWNSLFFTENCADIQICGWNIDGENPSIGVVGGAGQLTTGLPYEHTMAWHTRAGSSDVRFHDNRVLRWTGFVHLENNLGTGAVSPSGSKVYRNWLQGGEMGLSPVDTLGYEAYHNIMVETSLYTFDIEAESESTQCNDIFIHHNITDGWGIAHWYSTNWWLAANGAGTTGIDKPVLRLIVTDNYVKRGQLRGALNKGASNKGGLSFRANKVNPKTGWVISRNYTDWEDQQANTSGFAYNFFAVASDFTYTDNDIPIQDDALPLFNNRRDDNNALDAPTGTVVISGNTI